MQDTRSHRSEQEELTEDEVERLSRLLVPDPSLFSGDQNRRRPKPNLYVETVSFDEHGEEIIATTAPRGVDGPDAIQTHFEAGRLRTPATLPNYKGPPIRAVSLGYEDDDLVGWFDLDLDGDYPIEEVSKSLAKVFGKKRTILHSGSGMEGRYRLFGLIKYSMCVRRMNAVMGAICTHLGFPPVDGALEINPAYKHSRLPGGMGNCQRFDLETLRCIGGHDQAAFVRSALNLEPIDLDDVARKLGIDFSGIDTAIPRFKGRFDPYTRKEPHRPTPRHIRREIAIGVTAEGHRNRHTRRVVNDLLRKGNGFRKAVQKWIEYIESGRMDASRFVKRFGRGALIKQAEQTVRHIYANAKPYGLPDPIELSEREIDIVKELCKRVPRTRYTSPYRAEKTLLAMLPQFKSAKYAGLTKVRMHWDRWQAAGGIHVARMRRDLGIFRKVGGYKSKKLAQSRKEFGGRDSDAYAYSWACSFDFDPPSGSVTYDNAIATAVLRGSLEPLHEERTIVVVTPAVDPSIATTTLSTVTASIDQVDPLPSLSSLPLSTPQALPQLYVHHNRISFRSRDLDRALPIPETQDPTITTPQHTNHDPSSAPDALSRSRRRPKKRPSTVASPVDAPEKPKPKEWQRIAKWALPGAEGMDLDEWLTRDAEVKREYARELSRAKRKRDLHNRSTTMIRWVSAGECASERFHELRKLFGLNPWN
jgi:hypothetical protein